MSDIAVDLRAFIARTGTPPTSLGRAAVRDGNAVPAILAGRRPKPSTEARLRAWLLANPEGLPRRIPGRKSGGSDRLATGPGRVCHKLDHAAPAPVMRDPCPRCAVRGDIGCRHRKPGSAAPEITLAIWVSQPRRDGERTAR